MVQGILPGAKVELIILRAAIPVRQVVVDIAPDAPLPAMTIDLGFELQAGDSLAARQSVDGAFSSSSQPVSMETAPVFGPHLFYVVGHNPNTIPEVLAALISGANAVEPDVNVYSNRPNQLWISHGEGSDNAPSSMGWRY